MNETTDLSADLRCLSLLFSYPDEQWTAAPIPQCSRGATLLQEMRDATRIGLQNEYVRLFINSLPSLPCPPYGSFFLEGSVMGHSTMELTRRYQAYGMRCTEMADHLAVECEFLALLCSIADRSPETVADYLFVAAHLNSWAEGFFDLVELHDRLGPYRQGAAFGRIVCAAACRQLPLTV
ncbi:MAG: molecular chaperone TorD family protein [Desulfofustis sp.]|nr:molecular chaperone TorD family protein [Desulfofustis sp.]